jgi:hypothetical protein
MCKDCSHSEVLLELTYNQLLAQTKSAQTIKDSPRESNANKVQIQEVNLIPSLSSNTLTVKARTKTSDKYYNTLIEFSGVKFFTEGGHGRVEIQVNDGSTYFIDPIRPYKSNVKVRCDCLDFYFRFSVWDDRDDALTGDPPDRYQRKTDNYPPVNPQQVSGLCKHIIAVVKYLRNQKIIR